MNHRLPTKNEKKCFRQALRRYPVVLRYEGALFERDPLGHRLATISQEVWICYELTTGEVELSGVAPSLCSGRMSTFFSGVLRLSLLRKAKRAGDETWGA